VSQRCLGVEHCESKQNFKQVARAIWRKKQGGVINPRAEAGARKFRRVKLLIASHQLNNLLRQHAKKTLRHFIPRRAEDGTFLDCLAALS
jgi:hypothetical protein